MMRSRFSPVRASSWASAILIGSLLAAPASANVLDEMSPGYKGAQVRGVTLSIGFQADRISTDERTEDDDPDALFIDAGGGGGTMAVGYTFNPSFNLRLAFTGAVHETTPRPLDATYGTVVVEAQYRFASAAPARPYLVGGLGGAILQVKDGGLTLDLTGTAARIGGGLHVNLTRRLLADVGVSGDLINTREVTLTGRDARGNEITLSTPVEDDGGAVRLAVGLEWGF